VNVLELERALRDDPSPTPPTRERLDAIHQAGRGFRRQRRLTAAGAGASVLAVVAGLAWTVGGLGDPDASGRDPYLDQSTPTELSPLARRALREIPGARKVSAYQVVLPDPDLPARGEVAVDTSGFDAVPIALPADSYTGVTAFPNFAGDAGSMDAVFPRWLHQGIEDAEVAAGDPDGSYEVGSLAEGVIVTQGTAWLTCVTFDEGAGCSPTLMHRTGDAWYLDWGMGTDDFLKEGAGVEVFGGRDNFSTGRPTKFWIAGVDGEVARVDFLMSDGRVVQGDVAYDTVAPGDSMMWANVPVDAVLEKVVAYGPDGSMVVDHRLRDCSDPVDCEVR
jgi:hypothetical protein